MRRETFSTSTGGPAFGVTWDYDGASRLSTIASGTEATTYTYTANSGLLANTVTVRGGTPCLTSTPSYDTLERLTSINSANSSAVISSHGYEYDSLNRRTESVLADGSEWNYQYDAMGQVIAGEKRSGADWPVPGMKFSYAFDGIGNRTAATINGRTGSYIANVANQYGERQVPGVLDIRGRASMAARVTINTKSTQRLDEYFYKALAIDNSSAPQYPSVSVLAVRNNAGPNGEDLQGQTSGNLFLAKTPEAFTHDGEGNLTSDGRWTNTWDGENRLVGQETLATVPAAAKRKIENTYDAESRRIRKQIFHWNGTEWVIQQDLRFLYDGWNLVAELDATNAMLRNFVWGLDLSRTPQGAGGVGGLLAIREGTESHLPSYDSNGNVMALIKASDQSISARYEYGPFGETLVVEEKGVSNPFRFSTKYLDSETGWYYYGYRYYDPVTGRWPSRDPIEEKGGINLYGFVGNDGVNLLDFLGAFPYFNPGQNPAGGNNNYPPGKLPNPPPGAGRISISVQVQELNLKLAPSSINFIAEKASELNVCGGCPGDTIDLQKQNVITFAVDMPQLIGDLSSEVSGKYTISANHNGGCMWKFVGKLDPETRQVFDFGTNGNHNLTTNESLKVLGWLLNWNVGNFAFEIADGTVPLNDAGKCN